MCYTWNMMESKILVLQLATTALTVGAAYGADDTKFSAAGPFGFKKSIETGPFRSGQPALFEGRNLGGPGPFRWDPRGQTGYRAFGYYDNLMFPWVRKSLLGSAAVWMQEYYQPPCLFGVSVDAFLQGANRLDGYDALPPGIYESIWRSSPRKIDWGAICDPETNF